MWAEKSKNRWNVTFTTQKVKNHFRVKRLNEFIVAAVATVCNHLLRNNGIHGYFLAGSSPSCLTDRFLLPFDYKPAVLQFYLH